MLIRLIVGVLILLTMAFLAACRRDVVPPEPLSIVGNYSGTYRFIQIESGVDTVFDSTQLIELRFHSGYYSMVVGDGLPDSLRVFCEVQGEYVLGTGIDMTVADSNYTRGVCPSHWGFGGHFELDQTTDTLRLLSDQTDSTGIRRIRQLRLVLIQ